MEDAARRQRIVAKYEDALRRAIVEECSAQKLELAAGKVRESKLSLFKGQREIARYNQDPTISEQSHLIKLKEREEIWSTKTNSEIINEYR